jgi:hypothetical protein
MLRFLVKIGTFSRTVEAASKSRRPSAHEFRYLRQKSRLPHYVQPFDGKSFRFNQVECSASLSRFNWTDGMLWQRVDQLSAKRMRNASYSISIP